MAKSTLTCGPSGSGKTTFCLTKLREINLPVIIINGGSEYNEFSPQHRTLSDNFKDLSNSCIVIEDFVKQKEGDSKALIKLLGFLKRHHSCYIFLNTYMLTSTGASGLVNMFDLIVFTKHPANWKSMQTLSRFLPLMEDFEKKCKRFLAGNDRYLKFDTNSQKIHLLSDTCTALTDRREKKTRTSDDVLIQISEILKNFDEADILIAIISFIDRNVALSDIVNTGDFSIELENSRIEVKVSLIDFLLALRSSENPNSKIKALFRYFKTKFLIPSCFIKNDVLSSILEK